MTDGLRLGLGGAPMGNLFEAINDDTALALVRAASDAGCRTFDTASHYGNGLSEHRLGQALRAYDCAACTVSTKVGRMRLPDASAPRSHDGVAMLHHPIPDRFWHSLRSQTLVPAAAPLPISTHP